MDANSITDEFLGFEEGMHHNVTIAENNTIYEEHDWYVLLFQLNLDMHQNNQIVFESSVKLNTAKILSTLPETFALQSFFGTINEALLFIHCLSIPISPTTVCLVHVSNHHSITLIQIVSTL